MIKLTIEINGEDMGGSIFKIFERITREAIYTSESKQETKRLDAALDRDSALIAGELTDNFYSLLNEKIC